MLLSIVKKRDAPSRTPACHAKIPNQYFHKRFLMDLPTDFPHHGAQ